ncbi:hypothetical protein VMCG_10307 [Cytospora schulzeri]|uniref:Uncharacterized protein n=1 Tax=Cytospora schulzeri TaxID=448051 RepID=A0A423VCG0_9PEZI|nr:hypothetical protein VMCG_10307 [Valsa malicola]
MAAIERLGFNSEFKTAKAQSGEREHFEADHHSKGGDKMVMVVQSQPDELEISRTSALQYVFGTEKTMHESKVHHQPKEGKLMEAKGATTPPHSGHSKVDHSTTDDKAPDPAPTIECKGLFVKQVCPEDADRIAWYSLGLCVFFILWGGLMHWFRD